MIVCTVLVVLLAVGVIVSRRYCCMVSLGMWDCYDINAHHTPMMIDDDDDVICCEILGVNDGGKGISVGIVENVMVSFQPPEFSTAFLAFGSTFDIGIFQVTHSLSFHRSSFI